MVFANFIEEEVVIPGNLLRLYGLGYQFWDLVKGQTVGVEDIRLGALPAGSILQRMMVFVWNGSGVLRQNHSHNSWLLNLVEDGKHV